MHRPLRLRVEKLGPLRDTEAVFGDVTVIVGRPNTGKSYLLRALYEALAPGDPWGLASCIAEHPAPGLDADRLLRIKIKPSSTKGGLFDARVCLDYDTLAKTVYSRIGDCFAQSLLPPHRVEAEPSLNGLRRLRDSARRAAAETLIETYGGRLLEAEAGAVCVEVQGLRPPRRPSLRPWLPQGMSPGAERGKEAWEEEAEELSFILQMRLPLRLLVERCLAYVTRVRVVYAAYGRSVAAQILLYSSLPGARRLYEASLVSEILGERSLPFLSLYEAVARGYAKLLRGEKAAVEMIEAFKPLLMGKLRAEPGELVYEFNGDGVPVKFASALAAEASALMLAATSLVGGEADEKWLLIEEPESQLHPAMQAVAAAVILRLASTGIRVAVTTHSDVFAVTLLELVRAARTGTLQKALDSLAERLNVSMPVLEEEKLRRLDVRILYTRKRRAGKGYEVAELKLDEALSRLPGLSDVVLEVARWSLERLLA